MRKTLAAAEADKTVAREQREQERHEAALRAREEAALDELREHGFRICLYEPREYVEEDVLRGIKGHWKVGTCHVTADSLTGKKKTVSAMSAVDALDQVKAWLHYQETRLAPALRFVVATGGHAVPVVRRVVGDTAVTKQRRETTARRIL